MQQLTLSNQIIGRDGGGGDKKLLHEDMMRR